MWSFFVIDFALLGENAGARIVMLCEGRDQHDGPDAQSLKKSGKLKGFRFKDNQP